MLLDRYTLFLLISLFITQAYAYDAVDVAASHADKSPNTPYDWGANGLDSFDCTGLTKYAYGRFGIDLPRGSGLQSEVGQPVIGELKRGDLIFFDGEKVSTGLVSHAGIYEGNNKFIHANSDIYGVSRDDLETSDHFWSGVKWKDRILAKRRLPTPPGPSNMFVVGEEVELTEADVNVRTDPLGLDEALLNKLVEKQSPPAKGVIDHDPVLSGGYWRWRVNFESGPDGWVAQKYLLKAGSPPSPNSNPTAHNDTAITQSSLSVQIDVLYNDSDVDNDNLTITSVTQGKYGSVTINGSMVTYTSTKDFVGNDTFTYTISDGKGGSDTATVTVKVDPAPIINNKPAANDDIATAQSGVSLAVDVLTNDSDIDNDTLTITGVTQAANGAVTNNGSNVSYKSAAGYVGTDTFTYTISDGKGGTASANVTVTVNAIEQGTWTITPSNATVNENIGSISFTISRSDTSTNKTVYVSTLQDQGSSNNGDYIGKLNEALSFAAGVNQQPVTITINPDNNIEGNESFSLIVQLQSTDPIDVFETSAIFTITDSNVSPPTGKLLAHYLLDGNATDATGYGHHGTESGAIIYVPGVSGQAAQFNGNEQIRVPNFFSSTSTGSSLTVSLWMKTVTTKVIAGLVTQWTACSGTNKDDNFSLQLYNVIGADRPSSLSLNASRSLSGSELNASRSKVTDGNWHHVTVTYENGTGKLYVDGSLEDNITSTSFTNFNPNLNLVIGGYHSDFCSDDGHFEGAIDDVRIYDRALAQSEILELGIPLNNTPTTKLNDTGITTCKSLRSLDLACPVTGFPGQDAQYGRDAQAMAGTLQKVGGGEAGFDFTKLDSNGNPLPASASAWDCVKDNVTGLIWEVKTTSGLRSMNNSYSWYEPDNSKNGGDPGVQNGGSCTGSSCDTYGYVQAVNSQGLCGASNWRMPDVNELLSIVNNARFSPAIDSTYFPNTPGGYGVFWSSLSHADASLSAFVGFLDGYVSIKHKAEDYRVRLVRGGH